MGHGGTHDRAGVMKFAEYLSQIDDSHPMTTSREHIKRLCETCVGSSGVILELGSHAGISAAAIAMAAPDAVIVAVDLCDAVPESSRVAYWESLGLTNIRPVANDAGVFLLREKSVGNRFGVIFHDARHGEQVLGEYLLAAAMCRTLAIHDFEQLSHESQRLVCSVFSTVERDADSIGRELFIGVNP